MIDQDSIDEIKSRVSPVDLISESVSLKRQGSGHVGLCPFHAEKSPSFYVRDDGYHCFGCGASGNVISFVMQQRGLSFPEACKELAERGGITLKETNSGRNQNQPVVDKELFYRLNRAAQLFFKRALESAPAEVSKYLQERGLGAEACEAFGIGYAPAAWGSLTDALRGRGVSDEQLLKAGLSRRSPRGDLYDTFRARLTFPILHDTVRIAGFGGRIIPALAGDDAKESPKYINSSETPVYQKQRVFYGLVQALPTIRLQHHVYIVEGYLDVISLAMSGVTNVIATCGTAVTEQHVKRLKNVASRVTVLFDGDDAGRNAAAKCFSLFLNSGIDTSALFLPAEDDPDSIARRMGAATADYLDKLPRISLLECYLRSAAERYGSREPGDLGAALRGKLASDVGVLVGSVTNPVERDLLFEEVRMRLRIEEGSLDSLRNAPEPARKVDRPEVVASELVPADKLPRVDREILNCVVVKRELCSNILGDPFLCARLHGATLSFIAELQKVISGSHDDESRKRLIRELLTSLGPSWLQLWKSAFAMAQDPRINLQRSFEQCRLSLKKNDVIQQLSAIERAIRESSDESVRLALCQQKVHLSKILKDMHNAALPTAEGVVEEVR